MDVVYERCCGLDIHKQLVVACLLTPGAGAQPTKEIRTFGTMTADLLALADWLAAAGCTHVAMESSGVYWKPIYNLLEDQFTLLLVNAQHIKAVPGLKTDVRDCEWIADLLRHGLLRASELAHIDYLDEVIAQVSAEIAERLRPFEDAIVRLDTLPGVGRRTAEDLLAEIGTDMTRFPTAGHLASWAGMCPGNHESAGKRLSGRTRKGDRYLRAALVEAAQAAARTKETYLAAQCQRLTARRGKKKALVAVGHSILVIAY